MALKMIFPHPTIICLHLSYQYIAWPVFLLWPDLDLQGLLAYIPVSNIFHLVHVVSVHVVYTSTQIINIIQKLYIILLLGSQNILKCDSHVSTSLIAAFSPKDDL
mgnify:CR=1 FL=1